MKIVIDIDEEIYDRYMNYTENYVDFMFFGTEEKIVRAIRNGKPLPKGHGDLIDRQAVFDNGMKKGFCEWYDEIKYANPVIEAERGEN